MKRNQSPTGSLGIANSNSPTGSLSKTTNSTDSPNGSLNKVNNNRANESVGSKESLASQGPISERVSSLKIFCSFFFKKFIPKMFEF